MADRPDPVKGLERELAAIASATDGIDADPRIGEVIVSSLEHRGGPTSGARDDLARLAQATASLAPTDAFSDAVALRIQRVGGAAKPTSLDAVSRTGPIAAVVAAFAAAAALLLSFQTQREVDAVIVTSVLSVEVGE